MRTGPALGPLRQAKAFSMPGVIDGPIAVQTVGAPRACGEAAHTRRVADVPPSAAATSSRRLVCRCCEHEAIEVRRPDEAALKRSGGVPRTASPTARLGGRRPTIAAARERCDRGELPRQYSRMWNQSCTPSREDMARPFIAAIDEASRLGGVTIRPRRPEYGDDRERAVRRCVRRIACASRRSPRRPRSRDGDGAALISGRGRALHG